MQVFAKTDIGRERKIDEDYFYASKPEDKIKLFILADGMGGYNAGEVASKIATEEAKNYIEKNFEKNKQSKETIVQLLKDAVEYANNAVYKKSQSKKELSGMGTTLDVCLIYNSRIFIAHIGDSRVYRIRKDFMRKITRDDSYVQTLIEDGTITKEEAFNHPKKNMITKAIGCEPKVEPEVYTKTFIKDDIILMTSDGLTNMVKEDEIHNIIKQSKEEAKLNSENSTENTTKIENVADKLIKQANENGGYDNITVVLIM